MPRAASIVQVFASALACIALGIFAFAAEPAKDETLVWNLPKGFPVPRVPADNPITAAKVRLGRYLFYDTRMSVNGKSSCAACHKQELAFTDGRATAIGATGEKHSRNSMSLVNVAYSAALTWSNPSIKQLETQALVPMFGDHPIELGLRVDYGFLTMLRGDKQYQDLFAYAFPEGEERFTFANVARAIASFERSIISGSSQWDRYHYERDDAAISDSAKRGEVLFFSQPLSCFRCHGGFNFGDNIASGVREPAEPQFHNTGLYNVLGPTSYPAPNLGTFEFTHDANDVGKFKAPTLRNIAVTAPYMHDGSIPDLETVLDHYAAGGRTIAAGPYLGNGHENPNKDPLIRGFSLLSRDRTDLLEFLKALTDETVLHDPRFSDPWP